MEFNEQHPLRLIELFAGIGSQTQALKNIGIIHKVVAISEIDSQAIKSYEALHGGVNNLGDIREITELPAADLWTYSFPCTDISVAGKQAGIRDGTRSGLLLEVERLLKAAARTEILPKYLILENVKNLVGKKFRADFDRWLAFLSSLGYINYWQVLNAKDYGIPQNRERVFCISIRGNHVPFVFPEKQKLKLRLRDMLDEKVDERYYLKEGTVKSILSSKFHSRRDSVRSPEQVANCLRQRDWIEPQCVQVGELRGEKWDKMLALNRRVYDSEGLCPTVHCSGGGNQELKIAERHTEEKASDSGKFPVIAAMRGRNPENTSDRKRGSRLKQRLELNQTETSNTLTSVQKDNLVVEQGFVARKYEEFIKKNGYIPEFFQPYNAKELKDVAQTITSACFEMAQSGSILKMDSECSRAVRCGGHGCVDRHAWDTILSDLTESAVIRIRKLTPRECLRLMGWKDEQIDKIENAKVSRTQQYRQAGNGIVIQVLEAIFKDLFLS